MTGWPASATRPSPRRASTARSSPSTGRRPGEATTPRRTSARCTSSPPGPASTGWPWASRCCAEKSNEITAIPELLKKIDVRGGIVTIDAMGDPEGDRRGGDPRQGRLRPGPEGEPGVAAPGGHRAHRRAARWGPRGGPGADDDRSRARPRGDSGPTCSCTAPADLPGRGEWKGLKSIGVVTSRRVGGGPGEHRGPLLPQQPAGGRGAVRPGGARPLVGGDPPARRPTKR